MTSLASDARQLHATARSDHERISERRFHRERLTVVGALLLYDTCDHGRITVAVNLHATQRER